MEENKEFLTTQIITYLGNKRSLIGNIEKEVEEISLKTGKDKLVCADVFSGSGIVARMLKKHASKLIANDLENYSSVINSCYLINKKDFPAKKYAELKNEIEARCAKEKIEGILSHVRPLPERPELLPALRAFHRRPGTGQRLHGTGRLGKAAPEYRTRTATQGAEQHAALPLPQYFPGSHEDLPPFRRHRPRHRPPGHALHELSRHPIRPDLLGPSTFKKGSNDPKMKIEAPSAYLKLSYLSLGKNAIACKHRI